MTLRFVVIAGLLLAAAPAQAADTHCKKNHGASVYRAHVHSVGYARDYDDDDYYYDGVVGYPYGYRTYGGVGIVGTVGVGVGLGVGIGIGGGIGIY